MTRSSIRTIEWIACIVFAGCCAVARPARAQLNYRDVPIGGRTASMGGVGTAAGTDGAMPFLNPAGVSNVHGDIFALSAQVYTVSTRRVDEFFQPDGLGYPITDEKETFTSDQIANFPSTVMYLTHTGREDAYLRPVVAVSLVVPAAQKYAMSGTFKAARPDVNGAVSESKSIHYEASDLYFGPTYSLAIGKRINVGITAYMLYTASRLTAQENHLEYEFGGAQVSSTDIGISEEHSGTAIVPILGAQFELLDGLRMGAALAVPSIRIKGFHHVVENANEEGDVDERDSRSLQAEGYANRPLRASFGVSYERPKGFAVGTDAHLYASRGEGTGYQGHARTHSLRSGDVARDYTETVDRRRDLHPLVNASVGAEVWVTDWLAVRAGGFTNRSPANLDLTTRYAAQVHRYGGTLGVGILSGPFETTLGGVYQFGDGRMVIEDHTSAQAQPGGGDRLVPVGFHEHTFIFLLAGVVTTEEAKDTIKKELDKR